jgi:hypothetical protein
VGSDCHVLSTPFQPKRLTRLQYDSRYNPATSKGFG